MLIGPEKDLVDVPRNWTAPLYAKGSALLSEVKTKEFVPIKFPSINSLPFVWELETWPICAPSPATVMAPVYVVSAF